MPTIWPTDHYSSSDLIRGDYGPDQHCSQTRARDLRSLTILCCTKAFDINFGEVSHTGDTSWTEVRALNIWVPGYASDLYVHLDVQAKVSAGNMDLRLTRNTAVADEGVLVNLTNTSYASKEIAVLTGGKSGSNEQVEFGIDVRLSSGSNTGFVIATYRYGWFEDGA